MCGRFLTYVLYEIRETKLKTCDAFLLEEKPKRSYIVTLLAIFPLEFHFGQVWEVLFGLVLQTFLRFTCLMSYFLIHSAELNYYDDSRNSDFAPVILRLIT